MSYDFRSLSPFEFEEFVRDLLSADLEQHVESFPSGRDGGIDLLIRRSDGKTQQAIQCKHYVAAGYAALRSAVRREVRSATEVAGGKYWLVTSVPLTNGRKRELRRILTDGLELSERNVKIWGSEDLNAALVRHPSVERSTVKLWITSTAALERILNAAIWNRTDLEIERLRSKLVRYVPNASLPRAREVLEKRHYCIIAGIPGIGKTTLAEVLAVEYAERENYEIVKIAHEVGEVFSVAQKGKRQFFYFDDFLGKTTVDSLVRNEDRELIEFFALCSENPTWRFVLTTREYILEGAKVRHEVLATARTDAAKSLVKLEDYTALIRGKILYNHIYFSDIARVLKASLLQDGVYEKIVFHRNFNPRVVDFMTKPDYVAEYDVQSYFRAFERALEDTTQVWEHAFENQLTEQARAVLWVVATLPEQTLLEDLREAYLKFVTLWSNTYGFPTYPRDFEAALKQLDGSFLHLERFGDDILVSWHNPSVGDFLAARLDSRSELVSALAASALFFEQPVRLARGRGGKPRASLAQLSDQLFPKAFDLLHAPTSEIRVYVALDGRAAGIWHFQPPEASRLSDILELAALWPGVVVGEAVDAVIARAQVSLRERTFEDALVLARLIIRLHELGAPYRDVDRMRDELVEFLAQNAVSAEDFEAFILLHNRFQQATNSAFLSMQERFLCWTSPVRRRNWGSRHRCPSTAQIQWIAEGLEILPVEEPVPGLSEEPPSSETSTINEWVQADMIRAMFEKLSRDI